MRAMFLATAAAASLAAIAAADPSRASLALLAFSLAVAGVVAQGIRRGVL